MSKDLDLTADYIDVRDIIARVEELRDDLEQYHDNQETTLSFDYALQNGANFPEHAEEFSEHKTLADILAELCGNGGDEQWEGDWYPVTLIRDSYFEQSMDELLEDCGDIPKDIPCYLKIIVDYDLLKTDYTSIEIEGETYWYR